jgi:hypothetical protein
MYRMFIDDVRVPPSEGWVTVRSTKDALAYVKEHGMPAFISFDHDLGGDDTTMLFLRTFVNEIWNGKDAPPDYSVHSANPVGKENIISFMESWKRVAASK